MRVWITFNNKKETFAILGPEALSAHLFANWSQIGASVWQWTHLWIQDESETQPQKYDNEFSLSFGLPPQANKLSKYVKIRETPLILEKLQI